MKSYQHNVADRCAEVREEIGQEHCYDPRCFRCYGKDAAFCQDPKCFILPPKWPAREVHPS